VLQRNREKGRKRKIERDGERQRGRQRKRKVEREE